MIKNKKKEGNKEIIYENKMNEENSNKNQENINSSDNLLNLTVNNTNLSEINENTLNSYIIEDNKKVKHLSSFQQATEIIHSIHSFFQSFKKLNNINDNLNSMNSSNKIDNLNKKKSFSDTDLIIKKEKQIEDMIESSTNMEKIKIQRSKSIPFNNANSSQRNSCHYHKHSSLSSSITSSVKAIPINHDKGVQYDSESETNDSRLEYSTPKENDISFSFSSCQSSFSFNSSFTNKITVLTNNNSSDLKGNLPLSPKSILSEKSDMLSMTPHVVGNLEDIKEQESLTESLSTTPLGQSSIVVKDGLGTKNTLEKELTELDNKLKLNENVRIVEKSGHITDNNEQNISLLSEEGREKKVNDCLKTSTNSILQLLNQNQPSPLSSSASSLSSMDIQHIQPSSPSFIKRSFSNDINNKEDSMEELENKSNTSLPSEIIPYHTLSSSPSNIIIKSPELFKMDPFENSSNIGTSNIKNDKSLILFSLSINDDKTVFSNDKTNKEDNESVSSVLSENKILIVDNNRISSDDKVSSSYKDFVINNLINNNKEKSSIAVKNFSDESNVPEKNIERNRYKEEEEEEGMEKVKKNSRSLLKQKSKIIIKNSSKDHYLNPVYNHLINEDTLIDSENSSTLSNIVNISELELTSIPNMNANELQHSFENKSSNLIIEDLDNAEEFIQISNNETGNNKNEKIKIKDKTEDTTTNDSIEIIEPVITIEDTDLPEDHEKSIIYETNENKREENSNSNTENSSLESYNMNVLKERNPNESNNSKHEVYFSKELTSTIAYKNNNEKKDEDNYSYYSNAFSPEISISSVNTDDKYVKNYYDSKSQYYRKNKNKKSGDYEKSIKEYAISLEKEMMDFYLKNVPTEESKKKKLSLLKRIQKMFSERYPTLGIKAHLFGSSVNELGTYNSDVDICLTTRDRIDCELRDMDVIKRILEENGITQVRTTPNAKVPICNFVDPETSLSCDINVNNTIALYNTKMIQTYALIDERVKPLIMTIKYFAKQRMLNDAKTGTLSSYCWVNLVINFLQMRTPPILPCLHAMSKDVPEEERIIIDGVDCTFYSDLDKLKGFGKDNKETLYELIYGFFKTFANDFDYITDVVSVRSGCYKKKSDNGWNVSSNNTRIRNNYFCVEEPFNTARNLANCANRYSVKGLRWEFKRAFKILKSRGSLEELCEPYKPDPNNYSYNTTYYYLNQNRMELPINGNLNNDLNNGNIYNDHYYMNNPNNTFNLFKNGKNSSNSFASGSTMADKNGNWRIRNNNTSPSPSPISNNNVDNTTFQNKKFSKNIPGEKKQTWNMKKKPIGLDSDSNDKVTSSGENVYYPRRFPNDSSFMNNYYSNAAFMNNKKVNNRYGNNKNTIFNNNEKDIHKRKNEKSSNYEKSPNLMNEMKEMDNENVVIKHRFIEHHRNFDNATPFKSSSKYYYNNYNNSNSHVNNINNSIINNKSYNHNNNNNNNNVNHPYNHNNMNVINDSNANVTYIVKNYNVNNNNKNNNNIDIFLSKNIINADSINNEKMSDDLTERKDLINNIMNNKNEVSNQEIEKNNDNTNNKYLMKEDNDNKNRSNDKEEEKDDNNNNNSNNNKKNSKNSNNNIQNEITNNTNTTTNNNNTNTTDTSNNTNNNTNNNNNNNTKIIEDQTNPVIINNYYNYINQEYSTQFYKQLGYVSVQDPNITLTEEGINKQNIINSARYSSYPIFLNVNNNNTNIISTNGNNNGGNQSKQTNENGQNIMANFGPSYPVIGGSTYNHYYAKVNNVNLINYYIPAHSTAHPPGSPYQNRAHPLGYTVETIPIIPTTNQAIYNVASSNGLTIPEGGLYRTYHSIVPVVVDSSLNPILPHENIINDGKTTTLSTSETTSSTSHIEITNTSTENDKENPENDKTSKVISNNTKNEYNYNKQGNGTSKPSFSKKFNTSKSENKKSLLPNSQFHNSKGTKKSSLNSHKIIKQKIKEEESNIIHDTNTDNNNDDNVESNNESNNYNNTNFNNSNNGNNNYKKKRNKVNNEENEESYTINNFTIKNRNNERPSEFSLIDDDIDSEQDNISVDSTKSEEERTLYNEDIYCEPSQTESEDDDIENSKDIKGQSSNINIRNNITGNKSSEILLNIKNKNSSIEINLENNIIVNDVLIDYKNNKENRNSNNNKGKKSMDDNNKRNEKGKSITKSNIVSSTNPLNVSIKEKKNKRNNGNKEGITKGNSQNRNEGKAKGNNGNNQKNKNSIKNNKKEENKNKRKNNVITHKNQFTVKEGKISKNKESNDKANEKGDETTVITTVTTTIITNNSSVSNNKNINGNVNGTIKKEDVTTVTTNKSPSNVRKSTNKLMKNKKQKFKKYENDPNKKNTSNNNNNGNGNNNSNGSIDASKKKFKNGDFTSKNKPGKSKAEENTNNKTKPKGNNKINNTQ
jgi:DNA polymerase sigma